MQATAISSRTSSMCLLVPHDCLLLLRKQAGGIETCDGQRREHDKLDYRRPGVATDLQKACDSSIISAAAFPNFHHSESINFSLSIHHDQGPLKDDDDDDDAFP